MEMTIDSLNKRLSRLSDAASPLASLADSLDMSAARRRAREDEWQAAGNTGRMPPEPLEPPPPATARRYDRELWREIAHGEARVLFLPDKPDELRAAYAMSDADLVRSINSYSSTTVRP
jgi:hypothetical protein